MPAATRRRSQNLELTTTQKNALRVYHELTEHDGMPPSVRTLAAALRVSHHAAHYQIEILTEKGFLAPVKVSVTRLKVSAKGKRALGVDTATRAP